MLRHGLTQFYELRWSYESFSDVVLFQHRKIRKQHGLALSARQIHHSSQQAEIPIDRRVFRTFFLTLLNELVEQFCGDCPDQAVLEKRFYMFKAPNLCTAVPPFFKNFFSARPVIHYHGLTHL